MVLALFLIDAAKRNEKWLSPKLPRQAIIIHRKAGFATIHKSQATGTNLTMLRITSETEATLLWKLSKYTGGTV